MSKELSIPKEVSVADELVIKSPDDLISATSLLSNINKHLDKAKIEKEKITAPATLILKNERARWKPREDSLKNAVATIKDKMRTYQMEQERLEEEARQKIVSDKRLKTETAIEKMSEVVSTETKVETAEGSVTFVTDYEVIIEDIEKVPFEFLKVELRKADAKAVLKSGGTIAGLSLKEKRVVKNSR